jgi:hypothetical protein
LRSDSATLTIRTKSTKPSIHWRGEESFALFQIVFIWRTSQGSLTPQPSSDWQGA